MRASLVPLVTVALASCGTLVQVVDVRGEAVVGAEVQLVYPSFDGPCAVTDLDGWARLGDSWLRRPFFSMSPAGVRVKAAAGAWSFGYPPASVLMLDPSCALQRGVGVGQQAAVLRGTTGG